MGILCDGNFIGRPRQAQVTHPHTHTFIWWLIMVVSDCQQSVPGCSKLDMSCLQFAVVLPHACRCQMTLSFAGLWLLFVCGQYCLQGLGGMGLWAAAGLAGPCVHVVGQAIQVWACVASCTCFGLLGWLTRLVARLGLLCCALVFVYSLCLSVPCHLSHFCRLWA